MSSTPRVVWSVLPLRFGLLLLVCSTQSRCPKREMWLGNELYSSSHGPSESGNVRRFFILEHNCRCPRESLRYIAIAFYFHSFAISTAVTRYTRCIMLCNPTQIPSVRTRSDIHNPFLVHASLSLNSSAMFLASCGLKAARLIR